MSKYIVIMHCYNADSHVEPFVDYVDRIFDNEEKAIQAVENLCEVECAELNGDNSTAEDRFEYDEDGSGHSDYVVRLWHGDDYRIVTEYNIFEIHE